MKISVIIPVFNAALFLDKAIQSALNRPQVGEILLIDDRSEDDSYGICKEWTDKDHRIQLFRNEGMKGAGATRNIGIRNAKFDFITFLDADDYFLKRRFESNEMLFNKYPEVEAISMPVKIILSDLKVEKLFQERFIHEQLFGMNQPETIINIWDNNISNEPKQINGITFRKSVFEKIGYFDEHLKQCQDTDLILRMLIHCRVMSGGDQNPVAVYFRHDNNTTRNLTEAVYFRRMAAKKHFRIAFQHKLPRIRKWRYFKQFVEYDYLWIFGKDILGKKLIKLLMLPIFLYRILSTNQVIYNKDRRIDY